MTAGSLDEQSLAPSLLISPIFYWAWISDQLSGNAMRDSVKMTELLSVIKTGHGKEIRASLELGLTILTPSEAFGKRPPRPDLLDRNSGKYRTERQYCFWTELIMFCSITKMNEIQKYMLLKCFFKIYINLLSPSAPMLAPCRTFTWC